VEVVGVIACNNVHHILAVGRDHAGEFHIPRVCNRVNVSGRQRSHQNTW
jgi:hypothetical protein